jgi:hypothetical protein
MGLAAFYYGFTNSSNSNLRYILMSYIILFVFFLPTIFAVFAMYKSLVR